MAHNKANSVKLTAVVLTHNRVQRCRESLRHNARALQAAGQAEILLINNGSQPVELGDNIAGVLLRTLAPKKNLGAESRNLALKHARGEILLFLDDDVFIEPHHAQRMLQVFAEDPETGAVAFRIFNGDREEASLLPSVFHGCAVGIRRNALAKVGGYPRGYMYYAEEYHVAFRLLEYGYRLRFVDAPPHVQHVRDAAGRSKNRIIYRLIRNNTRLMTTFIPRQHRADALRDMLQRYRLVARKENAVTGYRKGLLAMPLAILTGLREAAPLDPELFAQIALLPQLDDAMATLPPASSIVLCGTGRFPNLWKKHIQHAGHHVAAFLDRNPCWAGQAIAQTPVLPDLSDLSPPIILLNGLSSFAETNQWNARFIERPSCRTITEIPAPKPENATESTTPQLHQVAGISLVEYTAG
jgi:GT2 family glycosyltransferase